MAAATGSRPVGVRSAPAGHFLSPLWPLAGEPITRTARFGPDPRAIGRARRWCRDLPGIPPPQIESLEVVVSELYTNALLYSASGMEGGGVDLRLRRFRDLIHVAVTDDGPAPGAPTRFPELPSEPDPLTEHGRGLALVARLSRQWGCFRLHGQQTTVWAVVDRIPRW